MSFKSTSPILFNGLMEGARPLTKIVFSILVIFVSYLTISLLSMILALPLFSLTWSGLSSILANEMKNADLGLIKYFQLTQTLALFLVPAILLNYLIFSFDNQFIKGNILARPGIILLLFVLLLVSIPLVTKLIEWNTSFRFPSWAHNLETTVKRMEDERNELTVRMLSGSGIKELLFNLFMIAIIPAFGEEFIFRGIIQQLFVRWLKNIHVAVCISAFLFSAVHFQFFGFIPRFMLGVLFGYLFYWSGSIWFAVWAHFINNVLAVIFTYMENLSANILPPILSEEYHASSVEVIISLVLTIAILTYIWSYFRNRPNEIPAHRRR
jgi:membrane protease YdiL (CAAX protease family)